jgi:tetratricopeptide (TPR) repeat protein
MALLGIHDEAIDYLTAALQVDPSCRPAMLQLALSYMELEMHEKALEALNKGW